MARMKKPTKAEVFLQDLRKSIKGRPQKQALDDFAAAIEKLVAELGKNEAMALYVRCGMLITFAKDESGQ